MSNKSNMNCLPVRQNGNVLYDIFLMNSYQELPAYLQDLSLAGKRVCIVTDRNVGALYEAEIRTLLAAECQKVTSFVFPAGEVNKNLDTVKTLYEHLILEQFDRNDLLIALGGGVVGDLTGFAAATYLRGIDFIQLPTTLLAQVDSSIGGKTGVDFDAYKNMVGAFYQPKMVYMNLSTLQTLPEAEFLSGMGEVLKYGLIKDASFYEWTIEHMSEIMDREIDVLSKIVLKSCKIKKEVVENDPMEKGERAILNLGHTIGHAVEKAKNGALLHGNCVALGTVAAAHISWKRGDLSDEEFFEIRDMNVGFSLPITVAGIDSDEILKLTKSDKKMSSGQIKFILLKSIGKAVIDMTVTDAEMKAAIDYINAEVEDIYE